MVKPLRLPSALVYVVVVRNPSERTTNSKEQSAPAGIVVVRSTGTTTRVGGLAAADAQKISANAATTITPSLLTGSLLALVSTQPAFGTDEKEAD
jgi:hypothetical protein